LTLKKPPPLVPSCLIATCEAAGPCGSAWAVTVSFFSGSLSFAGIVTSTDCSSGTSTALPKFCTTPCDTSASASTNESGSSTYSVERVRSTQKLPIPPDCLRTKPRMNATTTAMPVAAERKFCTLSPSICVR
jgi:hypothetical protein